MASHRRSVFSAGRAGGWAPQLGGAPAELDAKVEALVGRIAANSPTAIRHGKHAMRAIESMSFEQAVSYMEREIALTAMTEDAREGLASFAEKRTPRWTGRQNKIGLT